MAINDALALVEATGNAPVPLHLRNAPTKLMKDMGYAADYKYAHDYPGHFVKQEYMPAELNHPRLWTPQPNPAEAKLNAHLSSLWNPENQDK